MKNRIFLALAGFALCAGALVSSPASASAGSDDPSSCTTSTQACDPKSCEEPCDPACELCCCLSKMLAHADLTEEQLIRVDEILASEREAIGPFVRMAMDKKCATNKSAHKTHRPLDPTLVSALERVQSQLCNVLTPEQKARIESDAKCAASKTRTCAVGATS